MKNLFKPQTELKQAYKQSCRQAKFLECTWGSKGESHNKGDCKSQPSLTSGITSLETTGKQCKNTSKTDRKKNFSQLLTKTPT